jgi:hypothetical protein
MKKIILLLTSIALCYTIYAQKNNLKPKFDERTELLSVVFRLSGAREYQNNSVKIYTDSVDSYFASFKKHKVVKKAKRLRKMRGVAYDAIMSMAIHLSIENGTVQFNNNVTRDNLDGRWGKSADKFVLLLNDFYQTSNFNKFYTDKKELYSVAGKRFEDISGTIDLSWYKKFFGYEPEGEYNVVLSFINMGNYGPKVKDKSGEESAYSIICAWETDSLGYPVYMKEQKHTLVHEFCHSFCNPMGDKFYPEMKEKTKEIYSKVNDIMRRQAYGSAKTMVNEILVRASTIRYFQDEGTEQERVDAMIKHEKARGFLWIDKLYSVLNNYVDNRDRYKTFEDIMPDIVKLQNSLPVEPMYEEYLSSCPKIVSCSLANGSKDVSTDLKEIIIVYDRPMSSFGISEKGKRPKMKAEWVGKDKIKIRMRVELEPDTKYRINFYTMFNRDRYGFPMRKDFDLKFST